MTCELAKATRITKAAVKKYVSKEKDGSLKKDIIRPKYVVYNDQFVSALPGRLPNTSGHEKESQKHIGGTIL